jgi:hypothetical protein
MTRRLRHKASVFAAALAVAALIARTTWALTPLNDLGAGLYLNQFQGGLYPNASNVAPGAHAAEGLRRAEAIQPLNTLGEPDPAGKYALLSIGMSNTSQEFCGQTGTTDCLPETFMGQAAVDGRVNHSTLVIVNGAEGGEDAQAWDSPTDPVYDRVRQRRLSRLGVTEAQVQAIWLKQANGGPNVSLPDPAADAYRLEENLGNIVRSLKIRYPNLQQVFLSSRIYAGYATTGLNPEPYAYESGFAVKWLIEAQIQQISGGEIDPIAGDLDYTSGVAPWIGWGPYLWADGTNARSDGLIWEQGDFKSDGTHPEQTGREKVGAMLMDFMLTSPFTQPWLLAPVLADFDEDGDVDGDDLVEWQCDFGSNAMSDADGDGDSDGDDFLTWQQQLGSGVLAVAATAAVPEPATAFPLLLGAFVAASFARRIESGSRDFGKANS